MFVVVLLVFVVIMYYHLFSSPIYMNVNIRDACCQADNEMRKNLKNNVEMDDKIKKGQNIKPSDPFAEYKEVLDSMYLSKKPVPKYKKMDGDELLAIASINSGKKVLQSQINRAVWNKYDAIPYLKEELDTHANSIWYDNEELEQLMYSV